MKALPNESLLAIGTSPAAGLVALLGGELEQAPAVSLDGRWTDGGLIDQWRTDLMAGPMVESVLVVVWPDSPGPSPLVDLELEGWIGSMEAQFALWFAALAAGAERCADGGQLVAVVDRTDPKDAAGWGAVTAVADAVENMARSLARIHEQRGVRVNLVTSSARLTGPPGGTMDEVVGAVAMLLATRGGGVNATVIHLGGGL